MGKQDQGHVRIGPRLVTVVNLLMASKRPLYGNEICRQVDGRSGSVLPILYRLEAAGWATAVVVPHTRQQDRVFFELTEDGRKGVPAVLHVWAALGPRDADSAQ